jgi:hypothetical protein
MSSSRNASTYPWLPWRLCCLKLHFKYWFNHLCSCISNLHLGTNLLMVKRYQTTHITRLILGLEQEFDLLELTCRNQIHHSGTLTQELPTTWQTTQVSLIQHNHTMPRILYTWGTVPNYPYWSQIHSFLHPNHVLVVPSLNKIYFLSLCEIEFLFYLFICVWFLKDQQRHFYVALILSLHSICHWLSYPYTFVSTKVSLSLWHRRLAHLLTKS